jgi:type III restriction enzyme
VVGRGLRRRRYAVGEDDRFSEEVAQVLGVPFEVIPFKAAPGGNPPPPPERHYVYAVPEKGAYEITFPRVERYTQTVNARIAVRWDEVATLVLDPSQIDVDVEMAMGLPNNKGRQSALGRGRVSEVTLEPYHAGRTEQQVVFAMAKELTRELIEQGRVTVPAGILFPQLARIVRRYVDEKVYCVEPNTRLDLFLSPYWGLAIERLREAIRPDDKAGEGPELPVYEGGRRRVGTTGDVDAWTSKPVREAVKSHVNYTVADTQVWEQSVAARLDKAPSVVAFVKNQFLGFAIPYVHNGQDHEYYPDYLVRLKSDARPFTLILEVKGRPDPDEGIKAEAAQRWVAAVNAEGSFGRWGYDILRDPKETFALVEQWMGEVERTDA